MIIKYHSTGNFDIINVMKINLTLYLLVKVLIEYYIKTKKCKGTETPHTLYLTSRIDNKPHFYRETSRVNVNQSDCACPFIFMKLQ